MTAGDSVVAVDGWAGVVLAGGAGRRMGGPDKAVRTVGGTPMLHRVLAAAAGARPLIVVGPPSLDAGLPAGAIRISEQPAGGGPAAAAAAGLTLIPGGIPTVALLAADLPFLTGTAIDLLGPHLSTMDGAVFVDSDGRRQFLCGLWRVDALRRRVTTIAGTGQGGGAGLTGAGLAGQSISRLLDGLRIAEVRWPGTGPPPWYDCDTETELRQAEEWTT